jgi:hypothetical protein
MTIARNILVREAMLLSTRGWNVGDGARGASMSQSQWSSYRRAAGYPPGRVVQERICKALRLPPGALLWTARQIVEYPTSVAEIETTTTP